jgi:uncharacterized protein YmfQ (DUF2313 family)
MKAIHKYKHSNNREHQRRIAQSFGYQISIWDMPHMIALMDRAGIHLEYQSQKKKYADGDVIELS